MNKFFNFVLAASLLLIFVSACAPQTAAAQPADTATAIAVAETATILASTPIPATWLGELQAQLGPNYSVQNGVLYFTKPSNAQRVVVMVKWDENTATFNAGPDGLAGRESVEWAAVKDITVVDGFIEAIDNQGVTLKFDELSGFWGFLPALDL